MKKTSAICCMLVCFALTTQPSPEALGGPQTLKRCPHGKDVEVPACYNKVNLYLRCLNKRQCNDQKAYCGLDYRTIHTKLKVCVCKEYVKEVNGKCVARHYCSQPGLNIKLLQADCPNRTMFCKNNHCFCRTGYAYDRLINDCVPVYRKTGKEDEEGEEEKEKKTEKRAYPGTDVFKWQQFVNSSSSNNNNTNSSNFNTFFNFVANSKTFLLSFYAGTIALLRLFYCFLQALKCCISKKYTNLPQKEKDRPV